MKKTILSFLVFISAVFAVQAQQPIHKVVIQLNTSDTLVWHGALKNISNLQTALGTNTQIELVAHGSGISILIDGKTTQKAKIAELAASGVLFKACENTIRERKIDRASILSQAGTVPSGVAEVVLKQEAGWAYLKY
ncbi:DsrE family protein [Aquirufa regiilacus]|uniref:DsrE family protein n=1 Tax=Aquirufa regiilacus TaxID=3024868 RepID=A0ABU3TRM9_9BACT|nr:DsrE family protein [Aquirufa sp. LEOWEIH-7C]MDU0808518.1 DsrE family protein [Aquirufa sp. LEOWEIH-7C]